MVSILNIPRGRSDLQALLDSAGCTYHYPVILFFLEGKAELVVWFLANFTFLASIKSGPNNLLVIPVLKPYCIY